MDQTQPPAPDLTGAEVFVEADDRPVAGGRWYILPSQDGDADGAERVIYERPGGELELRSMVTATTLRTSPTWRPLAAE